MLVWDPHRLLYLITYYLMFYRLKHIPKNLLGTQKKNYCERSGGDRVAFLSKNLVLLVLSYIWIMILSLSATSLLLFVLSADSQVVATHVFFLLNLLFTRAVLISNLTLQTYTRPVCGKVPCCLHRQWFFKRKYLNSRDFAIGFLLSNCL